jgi:homoaconitase/3-isopropylmalate dehydratase large subunit
VKGGVGYAYEYAGSTIEAMSMEERMTLCNMSIEGGARCGYVNPDQTTYDYLQGRDFAPKGPIGKKRWPGGRPLRSDADASYDDVVVFDAADIPPTVTWGITPGQGIGVDETLPASMPLPRRSNPWRRKPTPTWICNRDSRLKAPPWMCVLLAVAPMAASAIYEKRQHGRPKEAP